jgi:hypothetical protein
MNESGLGETFPFTAKRLKLSTASQAEIKNVTPRRSRGALILDLGTIECKVATT